MRVRWRGALLRGVRFVPTWILERLVRVWSPSYTVGAMCRIEHDGQVLLVRPVYRQGWSLPGGLVGRREGPEDAARRESREETGLEVELVGQPIVVIDPHRRLVDVLFRARPAEGVDPATARAASAEIDEVAWLPASGAMSRLSQAGRLAEKVVWYDRLGAGGLVELERLGRHRSRRSS